MNFCFFVLLFLVAFLAVEFLYARMFFGVTRLKITKDSMFELKWAPQDRHPIDKINRATLFVTSQTGNKFTLFDVQNNLFIDIEANMCNSLIDKVIRFLFKKSTYHIAYWFGQDDNKAQYRNTSGELMKENQMWKLGFIYYETGHLTVIKP